MANAPTARNRGREGADDKGARGGKAADRRNAFHAGNPVRPAPGASARLDDVRTVVEKRAGVDIVKLSRVNRSTLQVTDLRYHVEFPGHDPIEFKFLAAARNRAKEPSPEKPVPLPENEGVSASEDPAEDAPPA